MISYITESEILKLPTYVCARTTRLQYENAVMMWNLIHDEKMEVYVYDSILDKRLASARRYDSEHRLTVHNLIISDYLVFVHQWELIKCRMCGDYSFEVVRSDKDYKRELQDD